MRTLPLITLALLGFHASAWAADRPDDPVATSLMAKLTATYPATEFRDLRATPMAGIYEVTMGRNVAYVGTDARHFVFGHLYDMQTQKDLTAERLEQARRIDFTSLPFEDAIQTIRGDGSRQLAVFSDPDCHYCRKLEQALAKLDNVTIHTFLYPLDELHPAARANAIAVWCAQDRAAAWKALMMDGKPPRSADCLHPIDRNIALARKLGVDGTPVLFDTQGRRLAGAAPTDRIETFLSTGEVRR
jgi:thiol:disulfide interchange protein DsbC